MSTQMAGIAITGQDMPPMPARRGAWGIYDVFDTADGGQLFIGVTSDQQWTRFAAEFALAGLAADARLADNVKRVGERSWLIPAINEVTRRFPQDEVAKRCERANVSWAPVGKPKDLFQDAHLLATNGLLDVAISQAGWPATPTCGRSK
jgi:crotonobetainyl-CoA:carnitine CoA-transferase CaiB-like acyl-CoA transferase